MNIIYYEASPVWKKVCGWSPFHVGVCTSAYMQYWPSHPSPLILSGSNIGHCLNWMTYYDVFQISFSPDLSFKKFLQLFESCNKQWWTRTKHFVQDATVLTLFPNQRKFLSSDHRVYTVQACSDWVMVSLAQTLHPGSDTNRNFPYMGDIFCTSDSNRSPSKNKK